MKYLVNISLILLSLNSIASDAPMFEVLLRADKSLKTYIKKVPMINLESEDSFDGKYFKIVKAKSNDPISFKTEDKNLLLKAATVYYHLNSARDYWINVLKISAPEKLSKMTIRLELTNVFDEQGHYAHDNRDPQFNNALSIPAGESPAWVPEGKKDKWGNEIWFRPKKIINTSDLPHNIGPNPITTSLETIEDPFINFMENQFNHSIIEHAFYPEYSNKPLHQEAITFMGTIALTKFLIAGSKKLDNLFIEKYFYLDSALVPEIIYHEYTHIVLSDRLALSHSTPVNEGMADYFAAVLSNKRKMYAKVAGVSNANPKDTQSKKFYSHWDESNKNAQADFALAVLWDVRETLGNEAADRVIYDARLDLKTESATISDHLIRAILDACERKCELPRRDRYKLYETFAKRGF
ncbi:MAG: hypothetical protein AB7I27_03585 [Bacteriovoracaceae bacterium]